MKYSNKYHHIYTEFFRWILHSVIFNHIFSKQFRINGESSTFGSMNSSKGIGNRNLAGRKNWSSFKDYRMQHLPEHNHYCLSAANFWNKTYVRCFLKYQQKDFILNLFTNKESVNIEKIKEGGVLNRIFL